MDLFDACVVFETLVVVAILWLWGETHGPKFRTMALVYAVISLAWVLMRRFVPQDWVRLVFILVAAVGCLAVVNRLMRTPRDAGKVAIAAVLVVVPVGLAALGPWRPLSSAYWVGRDAGGPYVVWALVAAATFVRRLMVASTLSR